MAVALAPLEQVNTSHNAFAEHDRLVAILNGHGCEFSRELDDNDKLTLETIATLVARGDKVAISTEVADIMNVEPEIAFASFEALHRTHVKRWFSEFRWIDGPLMHDDMTLSLTTRDGTKVCAFPLSVNGGKMSDVYDALHLTHAIQPEQHDTLKEYLNGLDAANDTVFQ